MDNRFAWPVRPKALQENIFAGKNYRFTVLTKNLIRMEYAPNGVFEDRASQTVFNRDFAACSYSVKENKGLLTIETDSLRLAYQPDAEFGPDTLVVQLKCEPASCWKFGEDFEDLGGTTKTLDEIEGACPVGRGVISRNGFSVLDDSESLVLEEDGWIGLRAENTRDVYFFGYGFDYLGALQAFYKLTGNPPMLPAYALGNWWSRYHAYTQQEYLDLMEKFRQEDVPLSVGVVDMDWHLVQIPEEQQDVRPCAPEIWKTKPGWTGYTWNKELFPDYKAFLQELKKKNLHVSLNLHPHDGIRRHEAMYEQMAKESGIDPKSGQRVPFHILSREFMQKYFDIVLHPYEKDGVDFWWMDWQQGTDYWWIHEPNKPGEYRDPRERLDPLWMLNHLHILDIGRSGKRPMFFSRYAGPGSHRYPVGFSGDTLASWRSLRFQPQFTAMASNIGYTWWSHDIGGHMGGDRDDELAVRWIQLGVVSPINRLHSSNAEHMSKAPWDYSEQAEGILKDWMRLRHRLFPYLYTMNYRSHRQGIPLVLPMYYSHPKCQDAYQVPNQYWFGSELIAAPITRPMDPVSRLGKTDAWLPQGDWFDFFNGLHYTSSRGRRLELHRDLKTTPILAKAGGIVPMARYEKGDNRLGTTENMDVVVFPGANNSFTLYEDAGDGYDYEQFCCATTQMTLSWGEKAVFEIAPAQGDSSLIPESRIWKIFLRGFHQDAAVSVNVPGAVITRDRETNTTVIAVTAPVTEKVAVTVTGDVLTHDNADAMARCEALLLKSQINYSEKTFMAECLRNGETVHRKLLPMFFNNSRNYETVDAFRELLSLTEAE